MQSRRAGSASQVKRHQGTHVGRRSGQPLAGHLLFRRAYPQRCFSIRRAGVGPSPAFPPLTPCKIVPQWLIPLPSMDSTDATKMRTGSEVNDQAEGRQTQTCSVTVDVKRSPDEQERHTCER